MLQEWADMIDAWVAGKSHSDVAATVDEGHHDTGAALTGRRLR
jgi:hypothetical protein